MINRAIYSLFLGNSSNTCGFLTHADLVYILKLSINLTQQHFKDVVLYVDDYGFRLMNGSVDCEIVNIHDDYNWRKSGLWIYPKCKAMCLQTEPFIHVDNDVLLIDNLNIGDCDAFFQNQESFDVHTHYKKHYPKFSKLDKTYAYNCGVVGFTDLSIPNEWCALVKNIIHNIDSFEYFDNHSVEQGLISDLCLGKNVQFLLKESEILENKFKTKYVHLWGSSKRNQSIINKIKAKYGKEGIK